MPKRIIVVVLSLLLTLSFVLPLSSATSNLPLKGTVKSTANIRNGPSSTSGGI